MFVKKKCVECNLLRPDRAAELAPEKGSALPRRVQVPAVQAQLGPGGQLIQPISYLVSCAKTFAKVRTSFPSHRLRVVTCVGRAGSWHPPRGSGRAELHPLITITIATRISLYLHDKQAETIFVFLIETFFVAGRNFLCIFKRNFLCSRQKLSLYF